MLLFASGAFLMTSLCPRLARAEPTAEDRAAAETLFRDAKDLIEKGSLEPACPKLAESQRLDPQIGTLLYLATCHEQIGKTATAWVEFTDALSQAQAAKKADREQQAQDGVARVEPNLSRATLHVKETVEGLRVTVNGREVRVFDTALPYDPGELVIVAEAPGRKASRQTITLEKGPVSIDVDVPALEVDAGAPPPKKKQMVTEVDPLPAFVVGGIGIGVTGLGLGLGAVAMVTNSGADDHCTGSVCTQEGLDGHDQADAFAWASNITVGVGLAAVATGVILYFVGPTHEVEATATSWAPTIVPVQTSRGDTVLLPGVGGTF
jgi:hypothetical protein